jgi:hypothetical protein
MSTGNKYHRKIYGLKAHGQQAQSVMVDVYSVIAAYNVLAPGIQQATYK